MPEVLQRYGPMENGEQPKSKFGAKELEDKTKKDYWKHYRMLFSFMGMVGDYESMLMLLPRSPQTCPSMNVETLYQFVKWKRGKKTEPLLDSRSRTVKDVLGNVVFCNGKWSHESNAQQFFGSMTCIHNAFGQFSDYSEICEACVSLKAEGNDKGCNPHYFRPKFWRSGNPVKSVLAKAALRFNTNDAKSHKSNAAEQLLPDQVELLRNFFIGANSLKWLQYYVMLLLSIKLFLRSNECQNLEVKDIDCSMSQKTKDGVVGMVVTIQKSKGKGKEVCRFNLYADHSYPAFCPLAKWKNIPTKFGRKNCKGVHEQCGT